MVEEGNELHTCSEIAGTAGVSVTGEGENIFFLAIYMYFPFSSDRNASYAV